VATEEASFPLHRRNVPAHPRKHSAKDARPWGKIFLVSFLVLGWGALAVYLFIPQFPWQSLLPFQHFSDDVPLEDVPYFSIPGVAVRGEKLGRPETFKELAERLGVSEAALRSLNQANDGSEPATFLPLWVPSKDGVFHWVTQGEGWSDIARAYGLPLRNLLEANQKNGSGSPKAGEVLYLPGGAYLSQEDPRWIALSRLRSSTGFGKPSTGRFADGFGFRKHPVTSQERFHEGLDLAPGAGSRVVASQSGVVSFVGPRAHYGTLIILDHGDGLTSWYAHLSETRVVVQQRVLKGDWIGRVGATGRVTGPHLHFEIRKEGRPQNPLLYLEK
jgi:murein DD-endopeptidase MepM/ murein hydrolase activator NlpD